MKEHQVKQEVFNTSTQIAIWKRLITQYLLLTPQDRGQWNSDPETFGNNVNLFHSIKLPICYIIDVI